LIFKHILISLFDPQHGLYVGDPRLSLEKECKEHLRINPWTTTLLDLTKVNYQAQFLVSGKIIPFVLTSQTWFWEPERFNQRKVSGQVDSFNAMTNGVTIIRVQYKRPNGPFSFNLCKRLFSEVALHGAINDVSGG
jgi:hypothetical protein